MLKFRKFVHLYENRIDFLKKNIKHINTSHDTTAEHTDLNKIIDHFANRADPSTNKQYTQWILSKYNKGDFRQEDHERIKTALQNFETHKSKLNNFTDENNKVRNAKDIGSYKNLSHLEDVLEPHIEKPIEKSKKQIKKDIKSDGANNIYEDKDIRVVHLKNHAAACLYGSGTRWCTAGKSSKLFNMYNEKGPIHYIEDKKTGEKFQLHLHSGQFMDAKDHYANLEGFVQAHPQLKDIPEIKPKTSNELSLGQHLLHSNEKDKLLNHFIENGTENDHLNLIQHFPETHNRLLHKENITTNMKNALAAKGNEEIGRQLMHDPSDHIRGVVGNNHKNLAKQLMNDKSDHVRSMIVKHREIASQMLNDPSDLVKNSIISHHTDLWPHYLNGPASRTKDSVIKNMSDKNWSEPISDNVAELLTPEGRTNLFGKLSPNMQEKAIKEFHRDHAMTHYTNLEKSSYNDSNQNIIYRILTSNNDHAKNELYNTNSPEIASALSTHTSNKQILSKLSKHPNINVATNAFAKLISSSKTNKQKYIDEFIDRNDLSGETHRNNIGALVVRHSKNKDHIDKVLTSNISLSNIALKNPNLTKEHKQSIAKEVFKTVPPNKIHWANQKEAIARHLTDPSDIDRAWKQRHNSRTFLIKNQKFVHAIHDNPNTSPETKKAAAATLAKYAKTNDTWKNRERN